MKKIGYYFLFILIFFGCGDESSNQDETVKDSVKDEIVVETGPEKEIVWEKDGKEMILIPSGTFDIGDHSGEDKTAVRRTVFLDAFYMDVYEVTVGQFRNFVNQSGYDWWPGRDDRWDEVAKYSPGDDYPMVEVTWNDAVAYAEWAGKRLPTEAEWEKAARGGLSGKFYVWGDSIKSANLHANFYRVQGKDQWDKTTAPVGSFFPNGFGLYDMAGNAREWCNDWYSEDYYLDAPYKNPLGPDSGESRVFRGGSWINIAIHLRLANRGNNDPNIRRYDYGFRCVSGSN